MGEHYIKEINKWAFVSHECSARASDIRRENRGLVEYKQIKGKSGAIYYGYKLTDNPTIDLIRDPKLKEIYINLKSNEKIQNAN